MKVVVSLSFFLALAFSLLGQTKHALLIGLGIYNPETGWDTISSANDIPIIKEALVKRGFLEKDIHIYIDALDRQGILDVMDKHLVKGVSPGDIAFFHFSGHGQQVVDNNKDELDGLDEALVPVDAPARNRIRNTSGITEPYQFNRHLRDDDLGAKLNEIRLQLGPNGNILVSIDACHSGTSTRGIGKYRGSAEPNVPNGWIQPTTGRTEVNKREGGEFGLESKQTHLATMACFYGSDQSQPNYEYMRAGDTIGYGSLSYALSTALNDADPEISYRVLFEQVQQIMSKIAPNQSPRVEGDLDQVIFGGKLLKVVEYYRVIKALSDSSFIINAGYLLNLNEGSKVGFFAPDTRDFAGQTPFAKGIVTATRAGDAVVSLDSGQKLLKKQAEKSWCYPLEINYGAMIVKMHIITAKKEDMAIIQQKIMAFPYIQAVSEDEQADLLLEYGVADKLGISNRCTLTSASDILLLDKTCPPSFSLESPLLDEIMESARQYAQSSFLRSLSVRNPDLIAEVLLVPQKIKPGFENKPEDHREYVLDSVAMQNLNTADYEIEEGDYIQFKIRNYSPVKVYYTLLDLFPDFKFTELNLLYPSRERPATEYVVPPYGEVSGETFKIFPPFGTDQLVLIVSPQPLDMRSIIQSREGNGTRGKGTGSAIETLFRSSFKDEAGARGPQTPNIVPDEIGIYKKVYRIVPRRENVEVRN